MLFTVLQIVFWAGLFLVFYTFIGYGLLLFLLVKIKEKIHPPLTLELPRSLPEITLFIAAYNEEKEVERKMKNCRELDYPKEKLHILWVTDGSDDRTNDLLAAYPEVCVYHRPERRGKTAALNRGMQYVRTPLTLFTDANTCLNREAILEIVRKFEDPRVGCVAGEKRIQVKEKDNAASGGEGFYWRYESRLKAWDARLYSAVGAAGELFAIRSELFMPMPEDTLLDDFILSMRIAEKGYKIAYCDTAYATESGSADMQNEQKRKIRIAAGGLQSILQLRELLIPNPFYLGTLRFQYISHRVLRWSLTPLLLFLLIPLNIVLVWKETPFSLFYLILLILQLLFYGMAALGAYLQQRRIKIKLLFIPYYFVFMNLNVLKAFGYLKKHKGKGSWEKAKRA